MVQLQILNKILKNKNDSILTLNDIDDSYFNEYPEEYEFIQKHKEEYGNIPDIETFIKEFEDFEVLDVNETDEYLIDTLEEENLYSRCVPILHTLADKLQTDSNSAIDYLKSQLPYLQPKKAVKGVDIISQANDRFSEWENTKNDRENYYIQTGFKELDDITGGFHKGEELVVLFARTGVGKTWVALKMLEHCWKMNLRVGLMEPEMSANKIGFRFDTLNKNISTKDLMMGNKIHGYEKYIWRLQKNTTPFFVTHPRDFKNKVYVSKLKNWCVANNLDVLCVDGISYLADERGNNWDNKTTQLTNISEDLMQLSIDLKIPVIIVVQSNRVGQQGEDLNLENIRDSDGIAFNSSLVISVQQNDDGLQLKIVKARNSRVGDKLCYRWIPNEGVFDYIESEPSKREFKEEQEEEF